MIIFDEEEYAIDIIENGSKNKSIFKDVALLAKYFRYKNNTEEEIKNKLYVFCKNNKKDFNIIKDSDIIENIILESKKWKLRTKKYIDITKSEFDLISSENNIKVKKILFVLLVISKFYHDNKSNDYYVNISDNDIFKLCNMYVNKKNKIDLMYYITQKGYITPNIHMSIKINFVDNENEKILNMVVDESMCNYLEMLLGKKICFCEVCGISVIKTNNRVKYCKKCARKVNLEQTKESVTRQRNKNKTNVCI